jgi:hypothetical protein
MSCSLVRAEEATDKFSSTQAFLSILFLFLMRSLVREISLQARQNKALKDVSKPSRKYVFFVFDFYVMFLVCLSYISCFMIEVLQKKALEEDPEFLYEREALCP